MKTKTFIILCLLLGTAVAQLSAQGNESKENYSSSVHKQRASGFSVYCGDTFVEFLRGTLDTHFVYHYKDGICVFVKQQWSGVYISQTGEVFKAHEEGTLELPNNLYIFHGNLIGDRGTRYIISGTYDYSESILTIDKAICVENE